MAGIYEENPAFWCGYTEFTLLRGNSHQAVLEQACQSYLPCDPTISTLTPKSISLSFLQIKACQPWVASSSPWLQPPPFHDLSMLPGWATPLSCSLFQFPHLVVISLSPTCSSQLFKSPWGA